MPSRYLIGIDLGTTNSVVAYIDSQEVADAGFPIRVFPIPQLVEHGEVLTLPALPSFLYFPTEDELSDGAVSATWDENPPMVTGVLARQQGALVAEPPSIIGEVVAFVSRSGSPRQDPAGPSGTAAADDFSRRSVRAVPHALARRLERRNWD